MPRYRKTAGPVDWEPTKWDGFTLIKTEHPYHNQRGSGRSECFSVAEDGMLVSAWTEKCAAMGYRPNFAVGGVLKLMGAKKPGWTLSKTDAYGRSAEEVKNDREINLVKAEARAKKAAEAASVKEQKKAEAAQKRKEAEAKKTKGSGKKAPPAQAEAAQ